MPERQVSTLVAAELGVTNGSNAGDGGRLDEPHQMALSAMTGRSAVPFNFPHSSRMTSGHVKEVRRCTEGKT